MTANPAAVLVVDDDADFCSAVTAVLTTAGYATRAVSSGTEALTAARRQRPALVLLDVNLPDISGYEICHQIRSEYGDELPIVFISGERTEDYDRTAGLLLGADDYLTKPFSVGELIARVRRAIDRTNHRESADANLTKREVDVLRLLADGLDEKQIAKRLFITPKTVATHIQRVLPKLGVHSRAEAVAFAHRNRLFGVLTVR